MRDFLTSLVQKEEFYAALVVGIIILSIDLILTYVIIARVVDSRQRARALPARQKVAEQILILHQLVMEAARSALTYRLRSSDSKYEDSSHSHIFSLDFDLRVHFIAPLRHHLDRTKDLVDMLSLNLGPELLSNVANYMQNAEVVIEFIRFCVDAFDPRNLDHDFLIPAPYGAVADLERDAFAIQKETGARWHPVAGGRGVYTSVQEIIATWRDTAARHSRLHFEPRSFAAGGKGVLIVPDPTVLQKAHVPPQITAVQTRSRVSNVVR